MANRQKGEVALEIEGQTYTLVLDMDAMCQLEDLFSTDKKDATFPEIMEKVQRRSLRHIRGVIWAALRRHHKDVTVEQAGELLIAAGGITGLDQQLMKLAESTQPDKEDAVVNGSGRPRKAQRRTDGTGESSTSKLAASA